jgi:hypothetical protein
VATICTSLYIALQRTTSPFSQIQWPQDLQTIIQLRSCIHTIIYNFAASGVGKPYAAHLWCYVHFVACNYIWLRNYFIFSIVLFTAKLQLSQSFRQLKADMLNQSMNKSVILFLVLHGEEWKSRVARSVPVQVKIETKILYPLLEKTNVEVLYLVIRQLRRRCLANYFETMTSQ